jgi:hypothetical protein
MESDVVTPIAVNNLSFKLNLGLREAPFPNMIKYIIVFHR